MSIHVLSVAGKMPGWVDDVCADYNKRLSSEYKINWIDLSLESRNKNKSVKQIKQKETQRLVDAIPSGSWVVALDERGRQYGSERFAKELEGWLQHHKHVSFVIGGPDGLDLKLESSERKSGGNWADCQWSLSELTFPHPMVRVLLSEQIYRAWSLKTGHPYHRE